MFMKLLLIVLLTSTILPVTYLYPMEPSPSTLHLSDFGDITIEVPAPTELPASQPEITQEITVPAPQAAVTPKVPDQLVDIDDFFHINPTTDMQLTGLPRIAQGVQNNCIKYYAKIKDNLLGHHYVVLSELKSGTFDTKDEITARHRIDWAVQLFVNERDDKRLIELWNMCKLHKISWNNDAQKIAHTFFRDQKDLCIQTRKGAFSKDLQEIAQLKSYQKELGALIKSDHDSDTEYECRPESLFNKMYPEPLVKQ